jgi:hypothetical protein
MQKQIEGGATIWARQTIDSKIFYSKPDKWFKIWFYLVSRVSHKKTKRYERGETFLQYEFICDKTGATQNQVKKCLMFLRKNGKIRTRRSTKGTYIEVINYSRFQTLDNYSYNKEKPHKELERNQEGTNEEPRYYKNDKNKKNDKNIALSNSENCGNEINFLIRLFKSVNPCYEDLFKNKTQRAALEKLLKEYSTEKIAGVIRILPITNKEKYAPTITTPLEFRNKLGLLFAFTQSNPKIFNKSKSRKA